MIDKHIKPSIILLALLLIFTSAQSLAQRQLSFGIIGGGGISNLHGNDQIKAIAKINASAHTGVTVGYHLPKLLSVHTGLVYAENGTSLDPPGSLVNYRIIERFEYLTIPLHVRFKTNGRFHVFGGAGGYVGYLWDQYLSTSQDFSSQVSVSNNLSQYKRFDAGMMGSIGLGFNILDELRVTFEIKHSEGMVNIAKSDNDYGSPLKTRTTNALIGLNYVLNFKH